MFSFMKIATVAALAFGTFASAIPAPAPVPEAGALEARSVGPTVTDVLTGLETNLKPLVDQMSESYIQLACRWNSSRVTLDSMTPDTATPDAVQNIVDEIIALLTTATSDCGSSSGSGSGDLLSLLSGVVTVRALCVCVDV